MRAWDIYSFQPPDWPEAHPAVIVSHPERVANKPEVTILMCSSKTATRPARPHEVILDASDGLEWPTLCKCDLLYTVPKSQLRNHRGSVTEERQQQIIATINRSNGWV
jgi:mRNA-degrading endonuclease toxin of MazEF toxin-antitoxin module